MSAAIAADVADEVLSFSAPASGSCFAPGAEFLNKKKRKAEGEKKDTARHHQHDEPTSRRYTYCVAGEPLS